MYLPVQVGRLNLVISLFSVVYLHQTQRSGEKRNVCGHGMQGTAFNCFMHGIARVDQALGVVVFIKIYNQIS